MSLDDEIIIKGKTPITCDNKECKFYGDIRWCYNGNKRSCGWYDIWERSQIKYKKEDKK